MSAQVKLRGVSTQKDLYIGDVPTWDLQSCFDRSNEVSLVTSRIQRFNQQLPSGWPVGLESDLLLKPAITLDLPKVNLFNSTAKEIVYVPGAVDPRTGSIPGELAAYRLWNLLRLSSLNMTGLLAVARLLAPLNGFRETRQTTTRFFSGHRIEYVRPPGLSERISYLIRRLNAGDPSDPFRHAAMVYFETLVIHPFRDGNGRLARLLFQGALFKSLGLRAPVLPLRPVMLRNRPHLLRCYLSWYFDHSPVALTEFLAAACDSTMSVIDAEFKSSVTCPSLKEFTPCTNSES